ncbi:hypothetical protein PanWU01x14_356520 [Parasponia andersonii]|uniref:Uncharacterized protein n=1 Tax=Parasponia andersonii TaxID=3476 RepID=A0A2P5A8V2_PARAD|nr:hypothetical protein PanWU01x14_356520 [Parasponia andersonii]
MSNKQSCTEQCDGDCNIVATFSEIILSENLVEMTQLNFTYSGKEYLDRSFSPSIVVIKSIICPEAVWNSTCISTDSRIRLREKESSLALLYHISEKSYLIK